MSIHEIEVVGASFSVSCYRFRCEADGLMTAIASDNQRFDIPSEQMGFHDADRDGGCVRGHFSLIEPFEVEHLVDGFTTKSLLKRIRTCEWFVDGRVLLVWGHSGTAKAMRQALSACCGENPQAIEFNPRAFSESATLCKEVGLAYPKDRTVRSAKLAGLLEDSDIDPSAHVARCKGLVDSPLGPITVTVREVGALTLGVRRGFVLDIACVLWVVRMAEAKADGEGAADPSDAKVPAAAKVFASGMRSILRKHGGGAVTISAQGKTATITTEGPGVDK